MRFLKLFALVALLPLLTVSASGAEFRSDFGRMHDRIWVGADLWANPMEDWHVKGGRLELITPGGDRNVQVLTRQLGRKKGTLKMSVELGQMGKGKGSAGFRIGIRDGEIDDYRAALIRGKGLDAGVTTEGKLFIGPTSIKNVVPSKLIDKGITLELEAKPAGKFYSVKLVVRRGDRQIATLENGVPGKQLSGNLALVANGKASSRRRGGGARFWFKNWRISGSKVEINDDHKFGPILWSMQTLSRGVLNMTAQMPPIGKKDSQEVRLQIGDKGKWKTIAKAKIDADARTARFRVPEWDDKHDVRYRLAYTEVTKDGGRQESYYEGTVRKDPVDKETIVVAGFTGNADYAFPNLEIVRNIEHHNPDVLFFSGDNIYEYVGGYGIHRTPADKAILNYLRKWYLLGMAFGDLLRDRVSVIIPDDHDVYQGNIWGNGGNKITLKLHQAGGYVQPAEMVNVVHRTQTSHLPKPFDQTPIKQGIRVYYTDLVYGRVSFAVIADRMFKSGPRQVATWKGRPDHLKDPNYDVKKLDKPGLKLLGDRQLKFLRHWASDWKGVDMQCVLSQTIFCNLANYHGPRQEYIPVDLDSGGWPQTGRDRAIDAMRRGFALHYAGDQHLASIVHHGIDKAGDANYSFCVPSIANFYPRSWKPDAEGKEVKNRPKAGLPNTGDYIDGLGNPIRVYAIANPEEKYRPGRLKSLHDKASGYGIVRFNRKDRTITMECWKLLVDASNPKKEDQFPGWPMTIRMTENYGREAAAYLPTIRVKGMVDPVVQIVDEKSGEIVYTLRIKGTEFRPKVFDKGRTYTVKVGSQEKKNLKMFKGVKAAGKGDVLEVEFE